MCVFYPKKLCQRHAPTPGHDEENKRAYFPKRAPTARCGDGEALSDGTGACVVACGVCSDWDQPEGGVWKPGDPRWGFSKEWWALTGWRLRRSPSPSTDEDAKVYPRVTHGLEDGCGDGRFVAKAEPVEEPIPVKPQNREEAPASIAGTPPPVLPPV